MQYTKSVYLYNNKYYGKVEYNSADQYDLDLFSEYTEPLIDKGGSFSDGTTSFSLTSTNAYVKTGSPFTEIFDPTVLSVTLAECGKRATVYVNTIVERIDTAMGTLRSGDATNYKSIKKVVV